MLETNKNILTKSLGWPVGRANRMSKHVEIFTAADEESKSCAQHVSVYRPQELQALKELIEFALGDAQ